MKQPKFKDEQIIFPIFDFYLFFLINMSKEEETNKLVVKFDEVLEELI